jgi:hypothetical protein
MTKRATIFGGDAAWTAAELEVSRRRDSGGWVHDLTSLEVDEIDAALEHMLRNRVVPERLTVEDFPLRSFGLTLANVRAQLDAGVGVFLVRGLPMARYSKIQAGTIFLGIGAHLGRAVAQNAFGDVLGHVRDLGGDWSTEMTTRGYQTTAHLPFHTDSCDVVGLLCLRSAKRGGSSSVASALAVHNEMVRLRPELVELLYEPFCVDRRGEEPIGEPPFFHTPIFSARDGRLYARYNRTYIESAQRFAEVTRLSQPQIAALDLLDAVCADPVLHYDMELQPGDMQFLNNYRVLHSRTQYEDFAEQDRKRHLLRLWLFTAEHGRIPDVLMPRYRDMDAWQAHPRTPTYDVGALMGVSEH